MAKLHPLQFLPAGRPEEKRQAKTLYIDADEDHVPLQYLEEKGNIKGLVGNTFMPKLVYVNGDGADWIKAGAKIHAKAKFVLDRYHMHKYIITATSHLGGLAQKARSDIWRDINGSRRQGRPLTGSRESRNP